MLDAPARSHPLGVTCVDDTTVASTVAVLKGAFNDEGHRFHAPVRVDRKGAAWRPVLRHDEERIGKCRVRGVNQSAGLVTRGVPGLELGTVDAQHLAAKHWLGCARLGGPWVGG